MKRFEIAILLVLACTLFFGCASIASLTVEDLQKMYEKGKDVYAALKETIAKYDEYKASQKPEEPSTPEPSDPVVDSPEDAVPFSSLNWRYGHFDGSKSPLGDVRITDLSCNNGTLYYTWAVGLSVWGIAHTDANALACAFVQRADGTWVGGKFDWVSTSRASRSLKHILEGYNGWTLEGVPNPCQVVFVVVEWENGQRRSNVAGPVTWTR